MDVIQYNSVNNSLRSLFTNCDCFIDQIIKNNDCQCECLGYYARCVFQVQSVVWFFRKHLDDSKETKVLTDHYGNKLLDPSDILQSRSLQSRFSIRLFSLLIFRASPDDSGIYICGSAHRDYFYGFDLDIQDVDKISFIQR